MVAAAVGAEVMYWTYDPLVSRNAHVNFNRLGARAQVALHAATGGIVPEVAARQQLRWIVPTLDAASLAQRLGWLQDDATRLQYPLPTPSQRAALRADDPGAWR